MRVEEYLEYRVSVGEISRSSADAYGYLLRQWCEFAGPVEGWTTGLAGRWVHDEQLRPNSRKNRLSRLRPYARWLVEVGELPADITCGVQRVRVPRGTPRDMAHDDVSRLLDVVPDDRGRVIIMLMAHCGLRAVEISRLRVEDVDVRRRTLDVRGKGGGGGVTRTVPVPSEPWSVLGRYLSAMGWSSGPIVRNQRWEPVDGISAGRVSVLVQRWVREAGLKVFPWDGVSGHALRHTCAQRLVDDGADIRLAQLLLGHVSVATTEIYVRREPPGLREAMEQRRYVA